MNEKARKASWVITEREIKSQSLPSGFISSVSCSCQRLFQPVFPRSVLRQPPCAVHVFAMLSSHCRRRGALIYLTLSTSFFFLCLFTSRNTLTRNSRPYPWQTVAYDEYGCHCPRFGESVRGNDLSSLCSDWSSSRGSGQRVVAYSVYGDITVKQIHKQYYSTIEDRIKDVAERYPGWVMRLYHNMTGKVATDFLCNLYCQYPHFDPCHVAHLYPAPSANQVQVQATGTKMEGKPKEYYSSQKRGRLWRRLQSSRSSHGTKGLSYEMRLAGKMWRFLPMADPLVSEFLVRDVDSAVLPREVAAVDQWLTNSTALIHLMRDHPSHNGLILAGMWGGSRRRGAANLTSMLASMIRWPPRDIWDYDQLMLKRVVWPEVLDSVLAHDSYFCGNPHFQSHHRAVPFPTRRHKRYFVGWGPGRNNELEGIIRCPKQCRPHHHQDWTLC